MDLYNLSCKLNVGRVVCTHMLGKEHSTAHHMIVGAVVMCAGVLIAKTTGHHPNEIIAFFGDAVGYGVHGLGLTPFVEAILVRVSESIVENI